MAGDQLPKPPASTAPPRCVRVTGTCRASRHLGPPRDGIPAGITGRPAPYRDRGSGGDVCGRKPGGNGRPVHILSVANIMPEHRTGRILSRSTFTQPELVYLPSHDPYSLTWLSTTSLMARFVRLNCLQADAGSRRHMRDNTQWGRQTSEVGAAGMHSPCGSPL